MTSGESGTKLDQIEASMKRIAADHSRMFSEWALGGGEGKWRSLDAPLFDDSGMTLGEKMTGGPWD